MSICLYICQHIVNGFLCIMITGISKKTNICNIILVPQAKANDYQIYVKNDTNIQICASKQYYLLFYALQQK